jgi:hypothetical protein
VARDARPPALLQLLSETGAVRLMPCRPGAGCCVWRKEKDVYHKLRKLAPGRGADVFVGSQSGDKTCGASSLS